MPIHMYIITNKRTTLQRVPQLCFLFPSFCLMAGRGTGHCLIACSNQVGQALPERISKLASNQCHLCSIYRAVSSSTKKELGYANI